MLERLFQYALSIAGSAADIRKLALGLLAALLPGLGVPGNVVAEILNRIGDVVASDTPGEQVWLEVDGVLSEYAQYGNLGSLLGKGGTP